MRNVDLHLKYDAGQIVETDRIIDATGGMNPVYYMQSGDALQVSSSAASLIRASDGFRRNEDFCPPEWFEMSRGRMAQFLDAPLRWLSGGLEYSTPDPRWYASWQTVDRRVFKLRPHEVVTPKSSHVEFDPDPVIDSKSALATEAARSMAEGIRWIEKKYPDAQHVVLTGGKDSLLIHLVPKENRGNWHVFSGQPNYPVVVEWLESNDLNVGDVYEDDSVNRESVDALRRKIVASDLYSDPRHIRWLPKLKKVVSSYEEKVLLWTGTEGDTFFSYHSDYQSGPAQKFWRLQQFRAPSWQGNFHQTAFNFTGAPVLSVYHTPQMIEMINGYDPKVISKGDDIRGDIGIELAGDVVWPSSNPSPDAYYYEEGLNSHSIYHSYLRNDSSIKFSCK